MKINETFLSIQGEGKLEGVPSAFVRFAECNLHCAWCDNRKSMKVYDVSYDELETIFLKYNVTHIVITGGEPMLCPEIEEITKKLKKKNFHITIESNATIKKNVHADLISMSPKLMHSGNGKKGIDIDVIQFYIDHYDYQLKFVVKDELDFIDVTNIIRMLKNVKESNILMMPLAGSLKELNMIQKEIVRLCIKYNYRYANRLQLQIWDNGEEI